MIRQRRRARPARRALALLAESQGGYFTAKQAAALGYEPPHLTYHVRQGNVERVGHGLYRVAELSPSEQDRFIRLSFWSRNRADEPQAVVSHETALQLHGLSDLLPEQVHLIVPPRYRKPAPRGCVLHTDRLTADEVEERLGFRVTTPLRTLCDVAATALAQEQLDRAVADALDNGLVTRTELVTASRRHARLRRTPRVRELLRQEGR